ncbi:hypothetical protein [Haliovirga abyssi]|uniref:Uncharacterized protein n=1 Tax=Haliovirga abyssi TaxID=2996794 RepID=A0AAU9DVT7_9FUSO|nr:hypothetical protein [Haliovirga abyssi]BDU51504.1 hypothetical protein HLVA_20730 [Haliovirga abyssi]
MRAFKEMLQRNSKKIILILIGILILFILGIISSVRQPVKKALKESKVKKKILYIPKQFIWQKYPKDFKKEYKFKETIKKNIARKEVIKKKDYEKKHMLQINYYDKEDRLIYRIEDTRGIQQSSWSSGRGGASEKVRPYPKEEGYIYDEKGRIIKKVLTSPFYYKGSIIRKAKDIESEERETYLFDGIRTGDVYYTEYSYNEKGELTREYKLKPMDYYEKEVIDYNIGKKKREKKMIDYEVLSEEWNKIYVEIDKEYDDKGKLIKKFVLRKNKFNAIRSETNFDIKKGEIITRYYDGDKMFATVTETMVGKDKAIVKRERVGDESKIIIVDYIEYISKDKFDYKKYKNYYSLYDQRYVLNTNDEIKFKVSFLRGSYEYNDTRIEGGVDKNSYKYESYFSGDGSDTYSKVSSEINNIFEIKRLNNLESEIYEYEINKEKYLEVLKNIMVGKLEDNIKKYLILKKQTKLKNESLKNEFKNITGGIKK